MKSLQSLWAGVRRRHARASVGEGRPLETAARLDPEELETLRQRWQQPADGGGNRREAMLTRLEQRRSGDALFPEPLDLRGMLLVDADLSGVDLTGSDLSGADLSRANLERARLMRCKLVGTTLFGATLGGAELAGSDLTRATLEGATGKGVGLGMTRLVAASLVSVEFDGATLTEADCTGADLRLAQLPHARLLKARLHGADLSRAGLLDADLSEADVGHAVLDGADLRRSTLRGVRNFDTAHWIGADIRDIDFTGAHLCRREALDQNFLAEFRSQSRLSACVYVLWKATSNCGRSFLLWGLWTVSLTALFALLYTQVGIDYGDYETWLSPVYYSVVTLTTLGYGDVLPTTPAGQMVAMAQVVLGYVMLGGLLSIFSNKMARRAE